MVQGQIGAAVVAPIHGGGTGYLSIHDQEQLIAHVPLTQDGHLCMQAVSCVYNVKVKHDI